MPDLHPVLQNIYKRRGQSVPVNDGRKIALVLYGGIMRGVRGGGAVVALDELGLTGSFDTIYSYSAGFANACYLLSGNVTLGNSIYYDNLNTYKFLNFLRLYKIMDIKYLIKIFQDSEKKINWENIYRAKTKLYTSLYSKSQKKLDIFEVHEFSRENFFKLLSASISIPFLNLGNYEVEEVVYRDAVMSKHVYKKHLDYALNSEATDILVIHNHRYKKFKTENTDRVFHIFPPAGEKLGRFEKRPAVLKDRAESMGVLVKSKFGINEGITLM